MKYKFTKGLIGAGVVAGTGTAAVMAKEDKPSAGVAGGYLGGLGGLGAGLASDVALSRKAQKQFGVEHIPKDLKRKLADKEYFKQYNALLDRSPGKIVSDAKGNVVTGKGTMKTTTPAPINPLVNLYFILICLL